MKNQSILNIHRMKKNLRKSQFPSYSKLFLKLHHQAAKQPVFRAGIMSQNSSYTFGEFCQEEGDTISDIVWTPKCRLCDINLLELKRKRRRSDPVLWQKPPIPTENSKTKGQHTQTPPKTSITQQLRTDLGRSVGVTSNPTGVVKPVYGIPTFPLTAKAV